MDLSKIKELENEAQEAIYLVCQEYEQKIFKAIYEQMPKNSRISCGMGSFTIIDQSDNFIEEDFCFHVQRLLYGHRFDSSMNLGQFDKKVKN